MPVVTTPPKPKAPLRIDRSGGNGGRIDNRGRGGGGDGSGGGSWPSGRLGRTGVWVGLASVTMLFSALVSAMLVRRGVSNDWASTPLPRILYLNTALLAASSATFEIARRFLSRERIMRFAFWLYVTLALGLAFVGGQLRAWHELAAQGVYLTTNPSSAFFYVLTAVHGLHLLGGIAALCYLAVRARHIALLPWNRPPVEVTAIYWHFMDGLWVFLLVLMKVGFQA